MTTPAACPIDHGQRKTVRVGEADTPAVSVEGDVWHVRSLPLVSQALREGRRTTQAGFNAEYVMTDRVVRSPILFLDGEQHKDQRAKIARYFAPKTVGNRYRAFMAQRADELIERILDYGEVEISDVSLRFSVEVAAQVIGLDDADMRGMARRLEKFFGAPHLPASSQGRRASRFDTISMSMIGFSSVGAFYLRDVWPAIRTRRKNPREDVISHLIAEGYDNRAILTECITYGAAGMVTTREFISMATWHLCDNAQLRERFLAAEEAERRSILLELLRLEPIVGHLYRRVIEPITLVDGQDTHDIPAGALLDLYVRQANADPNHVGEQPYEICPGRKLPPRIRAEVMSFGDGGHRCPGNHIALQESEIFLSRLFAHDVRLVSTPEITWDDLISGYEVRNVRVQVA